MVLALKCLVLLLDWIVEALRHLLLILEDNRVLVRLSVVKVLRLKIWLLNLRRSLESLLRNPRSDLVNLGWLVSDLSSILLVECLVGLTPRLLSKVVLLKRQSRRDLVWSLHVLVETDLHRGICLLLVSLTLGWFLHWAA